MSAEANKRLSGMLGLAMRAGKVVIGTEQVCLALRRQGYAKLVLVSEGASEATVKKLTYKCEYYKTRLLMTELGCEELGRLLGKTYSPAAILITDEGFAKEIARLSEAETDT